MNYVGCSKFLIILGFFDSQTFRNLGRQHTLAQYLSGSFVRNKAF